MEPSIEVAPDVAVSLTATRDDSGERVLLAARQSGLYRSRVDVGRWSPVLRTFDAPPATTAVASARDQAGKPIVLAGVNGGLLRSSDGTATWSAIPFAIPPPLVTCIVVTPDVAHEGIMLAGTLEDGVYRSIDYGITWKPANVGLLDMAVYAIAMSHAPRGDSRAIVGTESGVFLSTNGGHSWHDTSFPDVGTSVSTVAMSADPGSDSLIVAGTEGAGLFRSLDQGGTWQQIGTSLPGADAIGVYVLRRGDGRNGVLAIFDDAAFESPDAGVAWFPRALTLSDGEHIVSCCLVGDATAGASFAVALDNGHVRVVSDEPRQD